MSPQVTFCITRWQRLPDESPHAETTQRNRLDRRRSESWSFMGGTVARAASNDVVTCGSTAAAVIAQARRYPRRVSAYRYHHP
ncbi:conserved hypothetical protein [Burkholderia cenocepacia HI2424]|uniref:Uncharacterized protein n=2 Tax=Burkholderia cepacia complex TaxID=87882 RepID=A0A427NUJ9_9BURK|nr:conserved hypothetical protein [Burkholderia cenocepacia HI2424]PNO65941.1 hypothetical protein DK10_032505 [Burkholderia cenocepacia]RSC11131.1 hypothetical protein EGT41_22370 [Burkholderia cenocepacia]